MARLAFRNLFQNRVRFVMSTGGVALALLLILVLDAIFAGVEKQITAYIDHSQADLFVSQAGVRNLHMASSSLPASVVDQVSAVPGVQDVTPILYLSNMVVIGEDRHLAYVIGLPRDAVTGRPWSVEGKSVPGPGEAIIDRRIAEESGVGLGGEVKVLGQAFTIAGLSEGTASLVNSVAFISLPDFSRLRADRQAVSFVLVRTAPDVVPDAVAQRIEATVLGVTAQARPAFAAQERRVVRDMSTDLIAIMNLVGLMIGLAVMALMMYTAVLARRQEYGVLKALGARNADLYRTVGAQALISVAVGLASGVALTFLLSAIVPQLGIGLVVQPSGQSVLKVGIMSIAIGGLSALLPIRQIAGLDPAAVFRRR